MSLQINIPFSFLKLRFSGANETYWLSLERPDELIPQASLPQRLSDLTQRIQREVVDPEAYYLLLESWWEEKYQKQHFQLAFPAAEDGISFPAFQLEFHYYQQVRNDKYWGVLPELNVQLLAETPGQLRQLMEERACRYFGHASRRTYIQNIIHRIWLEAEELQTRLIPASIPASGISNDYNNQYTIKWLPKIGRALSPAQPQCIGQKEALQRLDRLASAETPICILLVGPRGVGKTALIYEWAYRNRKHERQIWETTAITLLQKAMDERGWEANLTEVVNELKQTKEILFLREFTELFQLGKAVGLPISIGDFLRPYLGRNDFNFISECTSDELAEIEAQYPGYTNYFERIDITVAEAELPTIIQQKAQLLTAPTAAAFREDAILESIDLIRRFAPYAGMPGDAIHLLTDLLKSETKKDSPFGRQEIVDFFARRSGMPTRIIDPFFPLDEQKVRAFFTERLFGQTTAIDRVVEMILRVKARLTRTDRPIASFFLVGPTGTGKTELARLLARFLFGSSERLLRFDMSEYPDAVSVLRLVEGLNREEEGPLLRQIRRTPFCVLLFDEIEKADSSFFDLLLQMLQEGRLSGSLGRPVSFQSAVIIMTSNLGAEMMSRRTVGPQQQQASYQGRFLQAVRTNIRPELFNRIDDIIPFHALDPENIRSVVKRELNRIRQRSGIADRAIELVVEDVVVDYLAVKGYDHRYGARFLQRVLRNELLIPLASALNQYPADEHLEVKVTIDEHKDIVINIQEDEDFSRLLDKEIQLSDAKLVGDLRRSFKKLRVSHAYQHLQDKKDKVHQERQKSLLADLHNIQVRLEETESRILLQLLAKHSTSTTHLFTEEVDRLQKDWLNWRTHALDFLRPDLGFCKFGVYGKQSEEIIYLYRDYLRELDVISEVQLIIYDAKGDGETSKEKQRLINWDQNQPIHSLVQSRMLLGAEWLIAASGIQLRLRAEEGLQSWVDTKSKKKLFLVSMTDPDTEGNRDFQEKSWRSQYTIRRTLGPQHIYDKPLGINQEYSKGRLITIIHQKLQDVYETLLDEFFS